MSLMSSLHPIDVANFQKAWTRNMQNKSGSYLMALGRGGGREREREGGREGGRE